MLLLISNLFISCSNVPFVICEMYMWIIILLKEVSYFLWIVV